MRMPTEAHRRGRESVVETGEIQEDEGLEELAEVGRAHQPGDGPVRLPARAVDDFADRVLKLTCQHDSFLQLCVFPGGSAELPEQLDERGALGAPPSGRATDACPRRRRPSSLRRRTSSVDSLTSRYFMSS